MENIRDRPKEKINRALEYFISIIEMCMRVCGRKIKCMVKVNLLYLMVSIMRGSGNMAKNMVKVNTDSKTGIFILETTNMVWKMGQVYLKQKMDKNMQKYIQMGKE